MTKTINPDLIRKDFPVYKHNPGLVYLDSSATQLKPQIVIDKINEYYCQYPSNIHRGLYPIAERASEEYEKSREVVARFIGAKSFEVIFTKGTTESLNLLAYSLGQNIKQNDEIVTTVMEHHANFVPWQQLCVRSGANLKVIDITDQGDLDLGDNFSKLERYINQKTKIVTIMYVSNVLGIVNPIEDLIKSIRKINKDIIVIVDVAQAIAHIKIDVNKLDADFITFSGHKMVGPTGLGVLWGKPDRLENLPPFQFGGDMIESVSIDQTLFKKTPFKFEAGTPPIASAIALRLSIEYLNQFDFKVLMDYEYELREYTIKLLEDEIGGDVTILGKNSNSPKIGIVSFYLRTVHPHDIAQVLSDEGVSIRAGHHCAMPLHTRLNAPSSARASFYIYNTKDDVDALVKGLMKVQELFI